jgi:hypothetical protein
LEITLDVARLPHRAHFTARFSDPASWQRTSVTAWHFLQRNSKSGIVLFKTSAPNGEGTRLNYSTTDKNVKSCKPNRKVKYSWVSYGVKHELLTYFRSSVVPHGQREREVVLSLWTKYSGLPTGTGRRPDPKTSVPTVQVVQVGQLVPVVPKVSNVSDG